MAKCCCNSRTGFALKSILLNSLYGSEQLFLKGAFTFFSRRASIDLRRRPPFLGVNERRRYLYMQVETACRIKKLCCCFLVIESFRPGENWPFSPMVQCQNDFLARSLWALVTLPVYSSNCSRLERRNGNLNRFTYYPLFWAHRSTSFFFLSDWMSISSYFSYFLIIQKIQIDR